MHSDDESIRDYAGGSLPQANAGDSRPSRRGFMKKVLTRSTFAVGTVALVSLTGDTALAVHEDYIDHDDKSYEDVPPHEDVPHLDHVDEPPHGDYGC